MSQDALGQLKHLKTARARWPFPDVRHMTVDELSALVEDQLAALDVVQSEPEEEVPAEGFVPRSE